MNLYNMLLILPLGAYKKLLIVVLPHLESPIHDSYVSRNFGKKVLFRNLIGPYRRSKFLSGLLEGLLRGDSNEHKLV